MKFDFSEVHDSWKPLFERNEERINRIFESLSGLAIAPARANVLRAFTQPLDDVKVLILGQDPYPGEGVADGLAFSTLPGNPLPASLRNIFKEYVADLGYPTPQSSDLSPWSERGVLLLNRTLTTIVGESNVHLALGWQEFTHDVALELARRNVVAIMWGKNARELAPLFEYKIESAHPSPLSARKGFFGSRPFSHANMMLIEQGVPPINWQL
jgi:uracil-DNA glycosylase